MVTEESAVSFMSDYMTRQDYLPVVFKDLARGDYLKLVRGAQDGFPDDFCTAVVQTQLEILGSITSR